MPRSVFETFIAVGLLLAAAGAALAQSEQERLQLDDPIVANLKEMAAQWEERGHPEVAERLRSQAEQLANQLAEQRQKRRLAASEVRRKEQGGASEAGAAMATHRGELIDELVEARLNKDPEYQRLRDEGRKAEATFQTFSKRYGEGHSVIAQKRREMEQAAKALEQYQAERVPPIRDLVQAQFERPEDLRKPAGDGVERGASEDQEAAQRAKLEARERAERLDAARREQREIAARMLREAQERIDQQMREAGERRQHGERRQLEERIRHVRTAAENVAAAGMHREAEGLMEQARRMEQELRGTDRPEHGAPLPAELVEHIVDTHRQVIELREQVVGLRRELGEVRDLLSRIRSERRAPGAGFRFAPPAPRAPAEPRPPGSVREGERPERGPAPPFGRDREDAPPVAPRRDGPSQQREEESRLELKNGQVEIELRVGDD